MQTPFDLLRKDPEGFIWLEAATDLELARKRLRELASYYLANTCCLITPVSRQSRRLASTKLSSWESTSPSNQRVAKPQ